MNMTKRTEGKCMQSVFISIEVLSQPGQLCEPGKKIAVLYEEKIDQYNELYRGGRCQETSTNVLKHSKAPTRYQPKKKTLIDHDDGTKAIE